MEFAEESAAVEPQQHFLITNLLLAINVIVFVVMLVKHVPLMSASADQILRFGANSGPLTMGGQPWRLLTNIFVHIGLLHILGNMYALFALGRLAESLYGRSSFLATYLFAGVMGSLATLLWHPMTVSAGASGALFGILGALITTLYAGKLPMPKHAVRPVLITLVVWGIFQFAYGFWKPNVDNAAHIGGFLAGLLIGFPLGRHLGTEAPARQARERIFIGGLLVLAIFSAAVWRLEAHVVQIEQARSLVFSNKADQAIPMLQSVIQRRPKEPSAHYVLALAYLRKSDVPDAERELKRAAELAPDNGTILGTLAEIYVSTQRWQEAATTYAKAAALGKDNGISWYDSGLAYRQLDRSQDAAAAFQKCLAVNPYFAEAWYELGISYLNLKQTKEAVDALQHAVKLQPNNAEMHLWLGNALLAAGQDEPSKAEFLKAFQIKAMQQRAIQQQQQQMQKRSVQPH